VAKFVIFFSYSNEAWARMIGSPVDRSAAVRQLLGSVDGSLESIYWMLGTHDGMAVADVPDSVSVAAVSIAITSTGAFKHVETHELLTQEQLAQALQRAGTAAQAYQAPGRQG
jgi:uncharacterized protein with GYD domain